MQLAHKYKKGIPELPQGIPNIEIMVFVNSFQTGGNIIKNL